MPATTLPTRANPAPPESSDVAAIVTATSSAIWIARIPPRASTYCSPWRTTTRTSIARWTTMTYAIVRGNASIIVTSGK